jgi:hypothetical protein
MITDKISMAIGAAGGLALGFAVFTTINAVWWLPDAKEEARAVERGGVYLNSTGRCLEGPAVPHG